MQVKAKGIKSSKALPRYMHNIYLKNNIKLGKKAVGECPGFGCTRAIHDFFFPPRCSLSFLALCAQ